MCIADFGPENLFSYEKLTLIGALLAVIWAIMTRRLVPGSFYEESQTEVKRLQAANDELRGISHSAAHAAEQLAKPRTFDPLRDRDPRRAAAPPLPQNGDDDRHSRHGRDDDDGDPVERGHHG
jgi:hypothetical protein